MSLSRRYQALLTERERWMPTWRDVGKFFFTLPRTSLSNGASRGRRRKSPQDSINDSTQIDALNVLVGGLLGGLTSPARPWFKVSVTNSVLAERHDVRSWLAVVTEVIQTMFARSNVYPALRQMYLDLVCFGVSAAFVARSPGSGVRLHVLGPGSYCLDQTHDGVVNTLFREVEMSPPEIVAAFPFVPDRIRSAADRNDRSPVRLVHAVLPEPNGDWPFSSVYFIPGDDFVLSRSGFEFFRVLAPRWQSLDFDVYGSGCPAMDALADVKGLQYLQRMKAKAIAYQADPPKQLPHQLRGQETAILPGRIFFYDGQNPTAVRSAFEVNLDVRSTIVDIEDHRARIRRAFHTDLFLALTAPDTTRMTATEVAQRHEEKILMLGPTIEQLHAELLKPLVEVAYFDADALGLLPPPPAALDGEASDLQVEFVSIMSQALRAVGLSSIDRFLGAMSGLAAADPSVLDVVNPDALASFYADRSGVDPRVLRAPEEIVEIRRSRAEAAARAQETDERVKLSRAELNLAKARSAAPPPPLPVLPAPEPLDPLADML